VLAGSLGELGHSVSVVAQRVDPGPHGWLTHTVREAPRFEPFDHAGARVRQFRLPRAARALLAPLAHEAVPLIPRLTRGRTRPASAWLYARVAAPVIAPLLAEADVVHVLGGAWVSVAAVAAARSLGLPSVVTPFVHVGYWRDDPASLISYRSAGLVLATTEADAADLERIGVPRTSIVIAGLPVPGITANADPEGPLVLFLGARSPHKGVDVLRAAARETWRVLPKARFAFVGPGAALPDLDQRELDVGPVSDAARATWMSRASLVALPSASESFGLVVAEAFSASRPVVTSDIPVLRELVERSGGGFAVKREPRSVAEAIVAVLSETDRASAMGRAGHDFWRRTYEPRAVAERHITAYAAALSRRARASSRKG
jgi:glycosyltransferase involved in cell wall biosynthesis